MSVQSEITRISNNVTETLTAIQEMGGTVPTGAGSDDMAAGVRSIPVGAKINDSTASTSTTYSSAKIEEKFAAIGTQEEIVQQVIAALGTPVFGTVDAENNIILSGNLVDGVYTLKYEDAEGNQTEIGTFAASGNAGPTYTNVLPLAVDTDGQPYNGGKGWKDGYRLNSSAAESQDAAADVTGFIPAKWGDTLYLDGVSMSPNSANPGKTYIYVYSSTFTNLGAYFRGDASFSPATTNGGITLHDNGMVKSIELGGNTFDNVPNNIENTRYVRISCDQITDESIITVNEPIS